MALETLAVDVAAHVASLQQSPTTYNPSMGDVLSFLRSSGEITVEEEKGLAACSVFPSSAPIARLASRKTR